MIKSMTGFGQSISDDGQVQMSAEVKSLNSKFLDLTLRLPKMFSDKEIEVRNLVSEKLERGKVTLNIDYVPYADKEIRQAYNESLFLAYFQELSKLAGKAGVSNERIFEIALNSPDVIQNKISEGVDPDEWLKLRSCIDEALNKCDDFRKTEGSALEKMLKGCIDVINRELSEIEKLDPKRIQRIRDRIKGNIQAVFSEEGYDLNRLEQEIVFYIEKLDINEEKVRLRSHLDYFLQIIGEKQNNGKKLGFISQEIGREINTIGSKANDADIQKHVVIMKEELEKIKEQLNNVL